MCSTDAERICYIDIIKAIGELKVKLTVNNIQIRYLMWGDN